MEPDENKKDKKDIEGEEMQEKVDYITIGEYRLCQQITRINGSRQVIGNEVRGDCSGNFIAKFENETDMLKFVMMKIKEVEEKTNGR